QTVHFNQLHKGTSNRVRYKKVDEATGEELEASDIVNGYPIDGEYVIVTKEELKEAAPGKSESMEITDFVDLEEIDPKFFRQTYYLGPRGKGSDRAYSLLLEAMRVTNRVGIATLVLRDKEHLVAVRPGDGVLILETMYFADEIRDPHGEIDNLPEANHADTRELTIAKQLVNSLSVEWTPEKYKNTYRDRVTELIEKKREGRAIVFAEERPKSNVIDLMAALEASVAHASAEQEQPKREARQRGAPAKASAKGEQQTFEGMSKAELLDLAARIDLQGRSKMTKPELVKALTETETEAPKPKRRRAS
ncbi:MAG: Ku protein, partial [Acidimicrobiales bacterium]